MKKFWLLLGLIGVFLLFNLESYAQLMVDEAKIRPEISPGQSITGSIKVYNTSEKPLQVKAYIEDFTYIAPFNGAKKFSPLGSTDSSCGEWIAFSPQEFRLPAFGAREVSYSIKVPLQVEGGYYAVLFFETSPGVLEEGQAVLRIVQRIGCLFFLESHDKIKRLEIGDISVVGDVIQGSFTNSGNVILSPKGIFYVMDAAGLVVDRGTTSEIFLPPQTSTDFSAEISSDLTQGEYLAVLTFELGDGDVEVREIKFLKKASGAIEVLEIKE